MIARLSTRKRKTPAKLIKKISKIVKMKMTSKMKMEMKMKMKIFLPSKLTRNKNQTLGDH